MASLAASSFPATRLTYSTGAVPAFGQLFEGRTFAQLASNDEELVLFVRQAACLVLAQRVH